MAKRSAGDGRDATVNRKVNHGGLDHTQRHADRPVHHVDSRVRIVALRLLTDEALAGETAEERDQKRRDLILQAVAEAELYTAQQAKKRRTGILAWLFSRT